MKSYNCHQYVIIPEFQLEIVQPLSLLREWKKKEQEQHEEALLMLFEKFDWHILRIGQGIVLNM